MLLKSVSCMTVIKKRKRKRKRKKRRRRRGGGGEGEGEGGEREGAKPKISRSEYDFQENKQTNKHQ